MTRPYPRRPLLWKEREASISTSTDLARHTYWHSQTDILFMWNRAWISLVSHPLPQAMRYRSSMNTITYRSGDLSSDYG